MQAHQLLHTILCQLQRIYDHAEARAHQRIIAEHLWKRPFHAIVLETATPVPQAIIDRWLDILPLLQRGTPIQLILREAYFYGRPFTVDQHTLIPRRETEELVLATLQRVPTQPAILDIGTGSGCIAITLAIEVPTANVEAIDISHDALAIAQANATTHCANIRFRQIDLLHAAQQPLNYWQPHCFHTIVANPPYIPLSELNQMELRVTQYEPHAALFVPDHDPLLFYRAILSIAHHTLKPNGFIACECHENLAHQTLDLFHAAGYTNAHILPDAQGKPRIVITL